MIKNLSWLFAAIFIIVGVLGFIPGVTSGGQLFGIFAVDTLHSIVQLLTGLVFVWAALSPDVSKTVFKALGVVYAIFAIVGLVQGDSFLGLMVMNMADNILYVIFALIALYVGFGMKGEGGEIANEAPPTPPPSDAPSA